MYKYFELFIKESDALEKSINFTKDSVLNNLTEKEDVSEYEVNLELLKKIKYINNIPMIDEFIEDERKLKKESYNFKNSRDNINEINSKIEYLSGGLIFKKGYGPESYIVRVIFSNDDSELINNTKVVNASASKINKLKLGDPRFEFSEYDYKLPNFNDDEMEGIVTTK